MCTYTTHRLTINTHALSHTHPARSKEITNLVDNWVFWLFLAIVICCPVPLFLYWVHDGDAPNIIPSLWKVLVRTTYSTHARLIWRVLRIAEPGFSHIYLAGVHLGWDRVRLDYHTYNLWLNKLRSVCVEYPAGTGLLMWPAPQPWSLDSRC